MTYNVFGGTLNPALLPVYRTVTDRSLISLESTPITRRSFPREAFPRDEAQGYFSASKSQRAETYPCASSRGNASRGKDRRVIGPRPLI